jgi:outer membrane cobalamin receptor
VADPQGLPIMGAKVTLNAQASTWTQTIQTDEEGNFIVSAVPAGRYTISVEHEGFRPLSQDLAVTIGSAPLLRFSLGLSTVSASVEVSAAALEITAPDASSPPVMVDLHDIDHTPGADRTSSLAFITDFVPGTYLLHDHLHMRGGHQVSWLVDGVPVPNTNISSNVGRALDPKDMETVEVSRGGYSSKYGDRTYGMINIVPRSGFEFAQREAELTLSYGSYNQTNNQLNFGGHNEKFAYYGSLTGNRTDLGLEPPTQAVIHNGGSGLAGFTSLNYRLSDRDELRLAASLRKDHYQVPNIPADQLLGIRDSDSEIDSFVNFSWIHTFSPEVLATISPLYHYNGAHYQGGPNDPVITTDHRRSNYVGAQTTLGVVHGPHNFTIGLYGFMEHDQRDFGLATATASSTEHQPVTGGLGSFFLDEQFKPLDWLTLNGGLRFSHFSGKVNENAADPRIGASIRVPKMRWVLRAFYGRYYQAPPLETISGPVLSFENTLQLLNGSSTLDFLPVPGERDEQHEFGLTIPVKGWVFDFSHFRTGAKNFSDHDVLGNSNITLPLAIQRAVVRGWESVIRSPDLFQRRVHLHLAYSNQVVKGAGKVTGGLTDFAPPSSGYFYIDHDQRNTLTTGGDVTLPWQSWFNVDYLYGSGFLDGNGPLHLPGHHSVDFSAGKSIGERLSLTLSVLNTGNGRFLYGRDSSFAGTHYNNPREIIGTVHYRFGF